MIRDLIDTLPDAFLIVDQHGEILKTNTLAEKMFGYLREEMQGQPIEMLVPESFRKTHRLHRMEYANAPKIRPMNEGTGFFGLHSQGHQFAIEIYLSPWQDGENEWIFAAIRDIRGRQKLEQALRDTQEELEHRVNIRTQELSQANKALQQEIQERECITKQTQQLNSELTHVSRLSILGEMTSGMAHELNQPLAAISNYSQGCVRRLSNNIDPMTLIPALERITEESARASEIITRFHHFARKETLKKQVVKLETLVTRAVDLERFEAEIHELTLEIAMEKNLPSVVVDEIQIQQVIVNLLRNAIEETIDKEKLTDSIKIKASQLNNEEIVVAVIDNGHGFTEQQGNQVFDSFFTTKPEGLGMGLSISRSIIEAHGGRLWANSTLGQGTTFYFSLPTLKIEQ